MRASAAAEPFPVLLDRSPARNAHHTAPLAHRSLGAAVDASNSPLLGTLLSVRSVFPKAFPARAPLAMVASILPNTKLSYAHAEQCLKMLSNASVVVRSFALTLVAMPQFT